MICSLALVSSYETSQNVNGDSSDKGCKFRLTAMSSNDDGPLTRAAVGSDRPVQPPIGGTGHPSSGGQICGALVCLGATGAVPRISGNVAT